LGYDVPSAVNYGLKVSAKSTRPSVMLIHGTSRQDKQWADAHWIDLAQRLHAQGNQVTLPFGNAQELAKSQALAAHMPNAQVLPAMGLDALTLEMSRCAGVIGVDSGLSHIAVALNLPHVQIYNFDTAWRTGPQGATRQVSVFDTPMPSIDAVWQSWNEVRA
jgi:heptosyltransferase-1